MGHLPPGDVSDGLVGVPDQSGYSECFERVELGLSAVPRLESYRGMYFVSFRPDIEDLVTLRGRIDAKVAQVCIAAKLHPDAGDRCCGQL